MISWGVVTLRGDMLFNCSPHAEYITCFGIARRTQSGMRTRRVVISWYTRYNPLVGWRRKAYVAMVMWRSVEVKRSRFICSTCESGLSQSHEVSQNSLFALICLHHQHFRVRRVPQMSKLDFNTAVRQEDAYLRLVHPTPDDIPGCISLFDTYLSCNGAH
jgi:hypothetical protein